MEKAKAALAQERASIRAETAKAAKQAEQSRCCAQ
jgi:hypothetical protein